MSSKTKKAKRVIAIALMCAIFAFSFETALRYEANYAIPWSPPTSEGISELTWIRETFGFDNLHTIVVVRDISSYLWALNYDGGLVYFGNVLYLMKNATDYSLLNNPDGAIRNAYLGSIQKLWSYGVLKNIHSANYSIVIPVQLYAPDPIELQALIQLGPGVAQARALTASTLDSLYNAWNLATSSKDMLTFASPFLNVRSLADCSTYTHWSSISTSTTFSLGGALGQSNCSLNAVTKAAPQGTLYLQLDLQGPTNLLNQSFLGLYFKGSAPSQGQTSLVILLSNDDGFLSFFSYTILDKGLWDGSVHGIVLPFFSFVSHGTPQWSSIRSVNIGVYSELGGTFTYSIGGLVTATLKS